MPAGMTFLKGGGLEELVSKGTGSSGGGLMDMLLPGAGILTSVLGGIFGSGASPQEEAMQKVFEMIQQYMPGMKEQSYSKEEINTIVKQMQTMYRGAGSLAATQVGKSIGESGAAGGQGFAEYYTSNVAPILAEGQMKAADAEQFGVSAYNDIFNSSKNRVAQMLQLLTGAASGQSSMTGAQKGIATGLQTGNLLATGYGNLAKGYRDWNYKPVGG